MNNGGKTLFAIGLKKLRVRFECRPDGLPAAITKEIIMLKEITKTKENPSDVWLEDIEAILPEEITEGQNRGKLPQALRKRKIQLKIYDLTGGRETNFRAELDDAPAEF